MKCHKCCLLSFFLIISVSLYSYNLKAQESILQDISYLYVEKLIATAKENYPRLKSLESEIEIAKKDLNIAKTSWLDPFSFQYVSRSNDANANAVNLTTADILTGYQFGISVNPGSLLSKPGNVKKAKEQINIARYNKEEYNLTLEAEVKKRYFVYLQYKNSLTSLNNIYLDAQNNFNVVKLAYQKAETTLEQYNAASTTFSQAYQTKLQGEANYVSAKASLEELTVKKLEEIK